MKKKALVLLMLLVLIAQLSFVHAADELLLNPGAEDGTNVPDVWVTWSTGGDEPFTWDSSVARSGSKSLKITNEQAIPSTWYQIVKGLDPNKEYILSGWIKTENATLNGDQGAMLGVEMKDSLNNILETASTTPLEGTNDWTYVEVRFKPNPDAEDYFVGCRAWGISGTVWFDDVSLKEATEAAAPQQPSGENNTAAQNPKTGDFTVIPFVLTAALSSMVVLKKRQK